MNRKSSTFFKVSAIYSFILMIGLFTSSVMEAEGLDRNFIAGMPQNFPPHFFVDTESGNPKGFGVDVMDAVARRCGIKIKYEVFESWRETNQAAKDGLIDIIPNMGFTSERKSFVDFTSPYETFRINYYIRATSSSIQSINDIKNRKVGVVITNKARFILEKTDQYRLVKVDTFEDLIWKLIAGDVDCISMPEPVMNYLMQKSGLADNILSLGEPLVEIKRGIGVTKDRKELFQLLQANMDEFILSQDFQDIFTKWYGKPKPYWTPKRIGIISTLLVCSSILGMAFWRYRFITKINRELEITVHDRTKKIEENEKRYKQMFLDNQAIKLVIDPIDGRIVEANDAACKFYQYPTDKLFSMKIGDINTLAPEKIQEEMEAAKVQNRSQFYFPHKLANGEIRDVEVYSGPINVGDKTLLFSIIHDISERKKVEVAIQKSEQKYRNLIQTASDAIYLISENGRFADVNPAACRMLNRTREEILNIDISGIDPNFSVEAFFDFWKETPINEPRVFETTHLHKDGSSVPVEVSGQKFQFGEGVFFFGIARDITERKKAEYEREKLQANLLQSQKMESIGTLAGGVAHDFNNMLGVILGYTELALDQIEPGSSLNFSLEEMRKAAESSAGLTNQLLAFARKQTISPKLIDINESVKKLLKMLRRLIGEDIDLTWLPGQNLSPVKIDPGQMDQILVNLCTNARDAIKGEGLITIETEVVRLEKDFYKEKVGFEPGEYVLLVVHDNGCGMDSEIISKIYDPFFTTKESGKGTGLGLATVYGIIKQNNGYIEARSEPGRGTSIKIYLPQQKETEVNHYPEIASSDSSQIQGDETILLVEDELPNLEITTLMLEREGYHVLGAATPEEAIKIAKTYPDKIHLLLTDVVMPRMNGKDLTNKIKSLYPDMRSLFMSGYTADIISDKGVLGNSVNFIQKPFSREDLIAKVLEALDEIQSENQG